MGRSDRRLDLAIDACFLFGEEARDAFERTRWGPGRAADEKVEVTRLADDRLPSGE